MASLARITGAEVHFDKHIHQGDDTEFSRDISINDKGFCICHPDIQLRKKGTFGGWTILKETCPKCDKIFELELERERLENMKFAADSGLAAEVGKTDLSNIPSEMVKWMQTLELPEAANNEILLILCGNEIGMTKPTDFVNVDDATVDKICEKIPLAKKNVFKQAVKAVKDDFHASLSVSNVTMYNVVNKKMAEPSGLVVSGVTNGGTTLNASESEKAEAASTKAHEVALQADDVSINARQAAAQWFGVKKIKLHDGIYRGKVDGKNPHGLGVMKYNNNEMIYEGNWKNGKPDGLGVLTIVDGPKYQGGFSNGVKNGHGLLSWVDGKVYAGEFQNNDMHGFGVQKKENKIDVAHSGRWMHDKPVGVKSLKRRDAGF